MKRIFISIAAVLCVAATSSAQTLIVVEEKPVLTNKHGVRVLPQAGDMGIGVSMTPFFNYFGNMFTRDGSNEAPSFVGNGTGINLKFFTADNQAIRAGVLVNFGKQYKYGNPTSSTGTSLTVTDEMITTRQAFAINLGYEWRRGNGRVQGFYGAQMTMGFSRNEMKYSYGNPMTSAVPNPWTWNFQTESQYQATERMLNSKGAAGFSIGLMGFVGVEYFFAPKISIGGEIGLGMSYVHQGETEFRSEYYNSASGSVAETVVKRHDPSMNTHGFNIYTATQGNIFLSFYF